MNAYHHLNGQAVIAILNRGWVIFGRLTTQPESPTVTLESASVVRRWGTTKGIGEIAINGPTQDTTLDPCSPISTHELNIVAILPAEESKWKAHMK